MTNHQLWPEILNLGQEPTRHFLVQDIRWESWVNALRRHYAQNVEERVRVGLLIVMAPSEAAGDHPGTCRCSAEIRAGRGTYGLGRKEETARPSGVGCAGEDSHYRESLALHWTGMCARRGTGAVARGGRRYRDGELGYVANDRTTQKCTRKSKEISHGLPQGLGGLTARHGRHGRDRAGQERHDMQPLWQTRA